MIFSENRRPLFGIVLQFRENLIIVLAKLRRRRIDARAAMRELERRERYAEAAVDAGRARMLVNDTACRKLRIRERLAHRAHPARRHVVRLQERLPLVAGLRSSAITGSTPTGRGRWIGWA